MCTLRSPSTGWLAIALLVVMANLPGPGAAQMPASAATPSAVTTVDEEAALRQRVATAESAQPRDVQRLVQDQLALAEFLERRNRPREAIGPVRRAVEVLESAFAANDENLLFVQMKLAGLLRETDAFPEALGLGHKVLSGFRSRHAGDHHEIAAALGDLAFIVESAGDFAAARELHFESLGTYERVLATQADLPATVRQNFSITLHNVGALLRRMDESERALIYLARALDLEQQLNGPDHPFVAIRLNVIGLAHQDLGRYDEALPLLQRALAISEKALGPDHRVVAIRLNNLAHLSNDLGQHEQALGLFDRAEAIDRRAFGESSARVATRRNGMAVALLRMGRVEQAQVEARRALALGEAALGPDHFEVAPWLMTLASTLQTADDHRAALPLLQRSLRLFERTLGPDHKRLGSVLSLQAASQWSLGDSDAALGSLSRALAILAASPGPELWQVQAGLRHVHAAMGQSGLSIYWGKQAVNSVQSLRGRLSQLPAELQSSFLRDKRSLYVALSGQLIDAGRLAEAQQVLAMLKDEELQDFLRRDRADDARAARAAFVGKAERNAEDGWRALSAQLAALGRERVELQRKAKLGLDTAQQQRLADVELTLAEANRRYDDFVAGLGQEFAGEATTRQRELGARQLDNLVTLQDTLREVGGDTVLLHYVVAERRVAIIVTTPEVQVARESAITPEALNRLVQAMRSALQARADVNGPARALHRVLIEPVLADIEQAGAKKLALSLDGALRYLPFAALHDGRQYLVERFGLSVYTEAARGNLARRPRTDWAMTGLGLTRAVPGFEALPAVRAELEGIHGIVLPGEVFFDEQFTAQRLTEALARQVPVLHIASHFSFRPGTDADSFLVLGDGGRMTLQEMRERRLRFGGVELLTLSACDTAMGGGRNENGAEVEGFGALAQRQGAQAVLATLWPVADQSTGRFMQQLYRMRQAAGDGGLLDGSKVQALRQTQLDFLKSPRYAHPYYWAPFILMGNWL